MEFRDVESLRLADAVIPSVWPANARPTVFLLLGGLIALRLVAGAILPLSADEAYYWLWSKHLAAGYYDHPPVIAFLIRGGTIVLGDTSIGVRLFPILLSVVATAFVWRSAVVLLERPEAGPLAALLFNLTLMVTVETLAATPDAPLIACAAGFLYALARLDAGGDGRWWLGVGVAGGLALMSKYSGFFLGLGAVAWILCVPRARRWLITPWPYLGLLVAAVIFAPNLWWNASHQWMTFVFQFGRIGAGHLTARYLLEFIGAQLLLATPAIFAIGSLSLMRPSRGFAIFAASILPATLYFLIHALHDRVQGNWPCFLYPALAIAAADGILRTDWPGWLERPVRWSARMAIPLALVLGGLCYAQALLDVVPLGRKDPVSRLLAFGFPDVGRSLVQQPERPVLTTDYETTAWLAFYLRVPVIQLTEQQRWASSPEADARLLAGPMLYLAEAGRAKPALLAHHFEKVVPLTTFDRTRGGAMVERYEIYRVEALRGPAIGRMP